MLKIDIHDAEKDGKGVRNVSINVGGTIPDICSETCLLLKNLKENICKLDHTAEKFFVVSCVSELLDLDMSDVLEKIMKGD